jgi:hypothetical protein
MVRSLRPKDLLLADEDAFGALYRRDRMRQRLCV